jgi:DNA repair exonuclease SbcCD ATPase subunit
MVELKRLFVLGNNRPTETIISLYEEVRSMHRLLLLVLMMLYLFPVSVSAEFYKYYDENGNVHFTDDYNQVPADQRPDVKSYVESTSSEDETGAPAVSGEPAAEGDDDKASAQNNAPQLYKELETLDKTKDELDKEYQSLIEENKTLEQMRKNVKNAEDLKKYNESVKALNQKFQSHDKKRQTYAAEVEAYNAKVIKANAARMKKNEPEETE